MLRAFSMAATKRSLLATERSGRVLTGMPAVAARERSADEAKGTARAPARSLRRVRSDFRGVTLSSSARFYTHAGADRGPGTRAHRSLVQKSFHTLIGW